ncbi:uncharacterized protein IWZ02DRAFT_489473 [Phyllosticta citriasiana]|uniref:uncharacterized protein n=1 Tax=Phyllosticta citriasiana TaxID=595635 RepID=UPI0030FD9CAC
MSNRRTSLSLFPSPPPSANRRPQHTASSAVREETGVPIPNVSQPPSGHDTREKLRSVIQGEHAATAESICQLRRLAVRLVVNIHVKEVKTAQAARSLAQSRRNDYLQSRKHEGRIAQLQVTLAQYERRNRELLHHLESNDQFALQSQNPQLVQLKPHRLIAARRPSSTSNSTSNSSSLPSSTLQRGASFTTGSHSVKSPDGASDLYEAQKINNRLIKAKKQSDHALLLCRSRIAALQEEYQQSQKNARNLDALLQEYKSKSKALEAEKAKLEDNLKATQEKLATSAKSEETLQVELEMHTAKIAKLEKECLQSRQRITVLEDSWSGIEERLVSFKLQLKSLEREKFSLQQEFSTIRQKFNVSEDSQSDIRTDLASKDSEITSMREKLRQTQKTAETLQSTAEFFEDAANQLSNKIESASGPTVILEKQLQATEATREGIEKDLDHLLSANKLSEDALKAAIEAKTALYFQLHEIEVQKSRIQNELMNMRSKIEVSDMNEAKVKRQVDDLVQSRRSVQNQLREALRKLDVEEQKNPEAASELDQLRAAKVDLEHKLKQAKTSTGNLQEELSATRRRLANAEKSKDQLMAQFEESQKNNTNLLSDVHQLKRDKAIAESELNTALKGRASLESNARSSRTKLLVAETNEVNLQAKLSAAEQEVENLRRVMREAMRAEGSLEARIAVAEDELADLRKANEELESLLSEAENGMEAAERTAELTGMKLLDASARLETAEGDLDEYRHKLLATEHQLRQLQQDQEEKFSLNYDTPPVETPVMEGSSSRSYSFVEETAIKIEDVNELERTSGEFETELSRIESELQILRENKRTFHRMVKSLRRHGEALQILDEWCTAPIPEAEKTLPPFPPMDFYGRGTPSSQNVRKLTELELSDWAREFERVRMLRDENIVQLEGLKRSHSTLKKGFLQENEADFQRQREQSPAKPQRRNIFRIFQWSASHKSTPWHKRKMQPKPLPPTPSPPTESSGPSAATAPQAGALRRSTFASREYGRESEVAQKDAELIFDVETRTWQTPGITESLNPTSKTPSPITRNDYSSLTRTILTDPSSSHKPPSRRSHPVQLSRPATAQSSNRDSDSGVSLSTAAEERKTWTSSLKRRIGL